MYVFICPSCFEYFLKMDVQHTVLLYQYIIVCTFLREKMASVHEVSPQSKGKTHVSILCFLLVLCDMANFVYCLSRLLLSSFITIQ